MNSLKVLKIVVNKLTKEEMKILFKSLSYNNKIENAQREKSLKLIKFLLSIDEISSKEVQFFLYGKSNYSAFNKLINRLKQKIYEIIILSNSINSNNFSNRNKVNLDLRKKLLQADILQLKGLRKNILPLYNYIILNSNKYELYDILVQALNSKQRLLSVNSKFKIFQEIRNEILLAENRLVLFKESTNIYNEISHKISNNNNYLSYKDNLVASIIKLRKNYYSSKSPTVGFYYYTLKAELHEKEFQYTKSKDSLENAKNILLNNESAYTINRYGTTILNLSNNSIFLYKFNESVNLAIEAKKHFKNLPFTLLIVNEILFYSYFYKNEFEDCNFILNEYGLNSDNDLIKSKFYYYQSCVFFVSNNFQKSIDGLLNNKGVEKDKEGWNINIRILTILNRIELEQFESVDLQVQNLDRYIKRISRNKVVLPRYILILRILTKLIQENYNYKKVFDKRIKYFNLLESDDVLFRWQVKSPELIVFHGWFKKKLNSNH